MIEEKTRHMFRVAILGFYSYYDYIIDKPPTDCSY